ncbi:DUF3727 domain-containing protein [Trichothermofontia sp.]
MDVQTLTLKDDAGRTLVCEVKHTLELDDQQFVLLLPLDSPVEIFAWEGDEDDEPEIVHDEAEIEAIFPVAKAVLAEQNLLLQRTAVTLTVTGELPDPDEIFDDEDDLDEDDLEDDEDEFEPGWRNGQNGAGGAEVEEFQLLARFFYHEQEYGVYAPLDPLLILARLDDQGQPHLMSPEEFERLEPLMPELERQLEDQIFNVFDD